MNLAEVLALLDPLEQRAVALVYFEGRTSAEAARILAVERVVVVAALALAFRRVARSVLDDDDAHLARVTPIPTLTRWEAERPAS